MRLTWRQVPNAAYYEVLRAGIRIATTTTARYDDRDAEPGLRYGYSVRAVNPVGGSGRSSTVVGFRPAA